MLLLFFLSLSPELCTSANACLGFDEDEASRDSMLFVSEVVLSSHGSAFLLRVVKFLRLGFITYNRA